MFCRAAMWVVFKLVLAPLIRRNYKLREEGKLEDHWYWADYLATRHGFFVKQ
jgi:hypothetical protein